MADAAHHSAKANPWSAYFPAKGVSCTERVAKDGVVKGTARTTVKVKPARKVVTQTRGSGRNTYRFVSGGRLRSVESQSTSEDGYHTHGSLITTLPSPRSLAHHRSGRQTFALTMTVPNRIARLLLVHGRTFRMTASYRAAGMGTKKVELVDTDKTMVNAVGYRVALRSIVVSNIKPAYRSRLIRKLRPTFAELQYTDWTAKGLGDVLIWQRNSRGVVWTAKLIGCGRHTQVARTTTTFARDLTVLGPRLGHDIGLPSLDRDLAMGFSS